MGAITAASSVHFGLVFSAGFNLLRLICLMLKNHVYNRYGVERHLFKPIGFLNCVRSKMEHFHAGAAPAPVRCTCISIALLVKLMIIMKEK